MLLRVPAGSLNDVATYGVGVQKLGCPYYGVVTRIAFDPKDAFPKFVFSPVRPLSDEEADMVLALRSDPRTDRILAEAAYEQAAPPAQLEKPAMAFEQPKPEKAPPVQPAAPAAPPVQPAAPAAPARAPRTAKAKPAPVAASPAVQPTAGGFGNAAPAAQPVAAPVTGAEDDLDAEIERLMADA
jgi:hypothetical protein